MTSFFTTRGAQSVNLVQGGGTANDTVTLHRGLANRLRINLFDDQRRPFNPLKPHRYLLEGVEPELHPELKHDKFEFHLVTAGFSETEGHARYQNAESGNPFLLHTLNLSDADPDDYDSGEIGIAIDPQRLLDLEPGHYELVVRMVGRATETDSNTGMSVTSEVADELLGAGRDFSPGIPVYVTAGVLPPPRPSVVRSFVKEKYHHKLFNSEGKIRYVTDSIDIKERRNRQSDMHTVAVYLAGDFKGRLAAQGCLDHFPKSDVDWFALDVIDGDSMKDGIRTYNLTGSGRDTCVEAFHFKAAIKRLRFWFEPADIKKNPGDAKSEISGVVRKVVVRS